MEEPSGERAAREVVTLLVHTDNGSRKGYPHHAGCGQPSGCSIEKSTPTYTRPLEVTWSSKLPLGTRIDPRHIAAAGSSSVHLSSLPPQSFLRPTCDPPRMVRLVGIHEVPHDGLGGQRGTSCQDSSYRRTDSRNREIFHLRPTRSASRCETQQIISVGVHDNGSTLGESFSKLKSTPR